jgi:hypothetical protein
MGSVLPAASDTFTPLPDALRDGLLATTVLAFMSFVSSVGAVVYITYRLITWEWVTRWSARHRVGAADDRRDDSGANDLSLGLEQKHYHQIKTKSKPRSSHDTGLRKSETAIAAVEKGDTRWNPILVLICNLLYADVIQSMSFLLNIEWIRENGIFVSTPACWAQGFFMQVGKVVLSGSLILISRCTSICYTVCLLGEERLSTQPTCEGRCPPTRSQRGLSYALVLSVNAYLPISRRQYIPGHRTRL